MIETSPGRGASLEAIESVYRTRLRDLLRMTQAIVGDADLARDSVHDAFVHAVRDRRTFRARGSLDGWIWRIALNEARDQLRRRPSLPLDEGLTVVEEWSGDLDRRRVRAAVALLPERARSVLFLRYFGDLDYESIGRILGIRSGTVAAALNAAHASLRDRLGPMMEEEEVDDERPLHAC
jgi:RNA polymerase sigma-70 factor (ECF subfamily)